MEEKKTVEKKKIDGISIFLIIIGLAAIIGVAYMYFFTDILKPVETKDMTGSSYIGEYTLDSGEFARSDVIDDIETPLNQTLILNSDGTGYIIDHNYNDERTNFTWEESENGVHLVLSGNTDEHDLIPQSDGRLAVKEKTYGMYEDTYWRKTK